MSLSRRQLNGARRSCLSAAERTYVLKRDTDPFCDECGSVTEIRVSQQRRRASRDSFPLEGKIYIRGQTGEVRWCRLCTFRDAAEGSHLAWQSVLEKNAGVGICGGSKMPTEVPNPEGENVGAQRDSRSAQRDNDENVPY